MPPYTLVSAVLRMARVAVLGERSGDAGRADEPLSSSTSEWRSGATDAMLGGSPEGLVV
jgi:hypothetical protein